MHNALTCEKSQKGVGKDTMGRATNGKPLKQKSLKLLNSIQIMIHFRSMHIQWQILFVSLCPLQNLMHFQVIPQMTFMYRELSLHLMYLPSSPLHYRPRIILVCKISVSRNFSCLCHWLIKVKTTSGVLTVKKKSWGIGRGGRWVRGRDEKP